MNKDKIFWIVTGIVIGLLGFLLITSTSSANYTPEEECVEISAPDPIEYKKGIIQYKWFESPEGVWTEKFDIDPRGGHELWIKTGKKIIENDCPEPEEPEEPEQPTPPSPYSDGRSSDPGATAPPAHKVCTLELERPTIWYENGQFKWATDQKDIEKFSIIYGETPESLVYGIDNIPADSRGIEIERPNWSQTWFQVWSWVQGCAVKSDIIDP